MSTPPNFLSFPVAPLAEQKRIVEKLDAVLGKVDACRQRLERIPTILKRFRQSVLAAACSGKLTADWRKENSISLDDWRQNEFGSLISDGPKNGLYKPQTDYGTGNLVVRIDAFYDGAISDWRALKRVRLTEDELAQFELNNGDILINRVNSPNFLGKCALVEGLPERAVFESNMMRIRISPDQAIPEYLTVFLRSMDGLTELRKNAKHAVNQSSINQKDVRSVMVPLPSLPEQQEIVRRVNALFDLADQLEARYQNAKAHVDKLTQSVLAKAFRGELVPTEAELARQEGRDYEPAAVLLERIQAERESRPKTNRKRAAKKYSRKRAT